MSIVQPQLARRAALSGCPIQRAHDAFCRQVKVRFDRETFAIEIVDHLEGLVQWIAFGKCAYGWSQAMTGEVAHGLVELREGFAACEASDTAISRPHFLAMLAEALMEAGEFQESVATLDKALAVSKHARDRYYESELYRLKGELLLIDEARKGVKNRNRSRASFKSAAVAAEECFSRAIEIAQSQQAKWFELRAVLSLCRLHRKQGKDEDVSERLLPVSKWFTEGFDTPDLVAARSH